MKVNFTKYRESRFKLNPPCGNRKPDEFGDLPKKEHRCKKLKNTPPPSLMSVLWSSGLRGALCAETTLGHGDVTLTRHRRLNRTEAGKFQPLCRSLNRNFSFLSAMVQEFHVLRCFSCRSFQVQQVTDKVAKN